MTSRIADVLIPLALDTAYSYAVPDGLPLEEGDVVQVPLANREVAGVVWSLRDGQGGNLKKVTGVIEAPNLPATMRKFLDWIAWYTLAPKGSALAMGLKIPDPDRQEVARVGVKLAGALPKRMTPARQKVIDIAQDGVVRLKSELAHAAGVSAGVVERAHRRRSPGDGRPLGRARRRDARPRLRPHRALGRPAGGRG